MSPEKLTSQGVGISSILITNVRFILKHCIREVNQSKGLIQGNNGFCLQAIPAYYVAVASVEAFLNEYYLGFMAKRKFKNNPLWYMPDEELERWELGKKLLRIPQFLFQRTFAEDTQPYQDMKLLIEVRNYLIHYKMYNAQTGTLRRFADLEQRKIILQDQQPNATLTWPIKLSCTEGIRWAHNTVCLTIRELLSFADDYPLGKEILNEFQVYEPIPESAIQWKDD